VTVRGRTAARVAFGMLVLAACGREAAPLPEVDLTRHETQVVAKIQAALHAADAEPNAATLLHLGRVLHAHEEWRAAATVYLMAAEHDGDHRFESLYLAGIVTSRDDAARALELIRQAQAVRGDYAPSCLRAGMLAEVVGDLDGARRQFTRALELERTSHALLGLARVTLEEGEVPWAIDLLQKARRLDPQHQEVTVLLAQALARAGRADEAQRLAAAVQRRHRSTSFPDVLLLRATAESVTYTALVDRAGRAALAGELDDAMKLLDRAIEASPETVEAHLKKGNLLATLGEHERAIAEYERAERADPGHGRAQTQIGRCYAALGRMAEAEKALRVGVQANPRSIPARIALADFLSRSRPAEALDLMRPVVAAAPDDVGARLLLATLLERRGDADAAVEQLQVVLRLHPGHEQARAAISRLRRR
jgi:tetratricopeptide (TPR) repeat protein